MALKATGQLGARSLGALLEHVTMYVGPVAIDFVLDKGRGCVGLYAKALCLVHVSKRGE